LDGQAQGNLETYGGEQDLEVEHDPIFIIFINTITSLQENIMEMQKYKFSPQEDY